MEAIQPLIGMSKPARRYISARAAGEALLALVALGCAAALFASRSASAPRAAPLATPAGDYCISPLCLHALGGGASRRWVGNSSGGSLAVLRSAAHLQFWRELARCPVLSPAAAAD